MYNPLLYLFAFCLVCFLIIYGTVYFDNRRRRKRLKETNKDYWKG